MNRLKIIPLLIFFWNLSAAQDGYFKYKTINRDYFSFPVFNAGTGNSVVEKINQFLQLSELNLLQGYEKKDLFERVYSSDNGIVIGKTDIDFQIPENNGKFLSIQFTESGEGATISHWIQYYNFNSGNGDRISLQDLFTPGGFKTLKKIIFEKESDSLRNQVARLDTSDISPEDKEELLSRTLNCFKDNDLSGFYMKDNSIYIDGENCLSKFDKALDLDLLIRFDLPVFKDYLNEYGKTAFSISKDNIASFRSTQLPQLFSGTIGDNLYIVLIINIYYDDGAVDGTYAYMNQGKGIDLRGKFENKTLALTESTDDFDETGHISATLEGDSITGVWTNKDGTKILKLIAKRK